MVIATSVGQHGVFEVGGSIWWLRSGFSIWCLGSGRFCVAILKWVWSIWLLGSMWGNSGDMEMDGTILVIVKWVGSFCRLEVVIGKWMGSLCGVCGVCMYVRVYVCKVSGLC